MPEWGRSPGGARLPARARRAGILLAGVLLAGCAQIPTSGPVVAGQPVDAPRRPPNIFAEEAPAGASPEQLVLGFLKAAADYHREHAVARSYLAPAPLGRQTSWVADAPVVIYGGPGPQLRGPLIPVTAPTASTDPSATRPVATGRTSVARTSVARTSVARTSVARTSVARTSAPTTTGSSSSAPRVTSPTFVSRPPMPPDGTRTTVTVTVPVLASIDATGVYTPAPSGRVESRVFGLVVTRGQWRIATLDPGILVSQFDFRSTFQDLPVYFPDPLGTWMVPDVRWFPVTGGATVVKLVTALLNGPSPWLAPAVHSAFPPGTRLNVTESVPVDGNGVASVDLTRAVLTATPPQRQILRDQLRDTLGLSAGGTVSATGLTDVTVKVAGSALDIPDPRVDSAQGQPPEPGPRLALASTSAFEPFPVVIDARGRIARLRDREVVPVEGTDSFQTPAGLTDPAVSGDGATFAALTAARTKLLLAPKGGKATAVVTGRELTAPSLDPQGWVWTASAPPVGSATPVITAARVGSAAVEVAAPGLSGVTVSTLRISRDGSRALVLGHRGSAAVLMVAAITRTVDGNCNGSAAAGDAGHAATAVPGLPSGAASSPTAAIGGEPCSLGSTTLALMPDLVAARDATWADDHTVIVLGTNGSVTADLADQPWLVEVGGRIEATVALGSVAKTADRVAAVKDDIYLGAQDGRVWRREFGSWSLVTAAGVIARSPAMPG